MAGPQTIFSTGMRNELLGVADLTTILQRAGAGAPDRFCVRLFGHTTPSAAPVYSGTSIPTNADALKTGTEIVCIRPASEAALSFSAPSNGVLSKNVAQDWYGTVNAPGAGNVWVPVYWRLELAGDTGVFSTTALRVQGNVGNSGDFSGILATQVIPSAVTQYIDSFSISLPSGE